MEQKEQLLESACKTGNEVLALDLLKNAQINVNWRNENENGFGPLHQACFNGHLEIVKALLQHPLINVNLPMRLLATPLYLACQGNRSEIVELLVKDPRVDVNLPRDEGATPFFITCQRGHLESFDLLLAHRWVDVHQGMNHGITPLWIASCEGNLQIVKRLLLCGKSVDPLARTFEGEEGWRGKTVEEVARWATNEGRLPWEISDDEQDRRAEACPIIASLVRQFKEDPAKVRCALRCEPGVRNKYVGEMYALVVFYCDDYLRLRQDLPSASQNRLRFLKIVAHLPLDIQMVVCNRVYGSAKDLILCSISEPAFRRLTLIFSS